MKPRSSDDDLDRVSTRDTGARALYETVYADIWARIRSGEYPPDMRLPGERELSVTYGVSRVTVRQAIAKAEQHGLLTKVPGRGTFVARPLVVQDLAAVRPFRSSVQDVAMQPGYETRSVRWLPASDTVAESLGIEPGTTILQVFLLGLANGRPLASYDVSISPLVAADVAKGLEASTDRSTYELAAEAIGVKRLEVDQTFEATVITGQLATLLQVPEGSSAFRTWSSYATPDGRKLEWREAIYPGERYRFRAHRSIDL